MLVKATCNPQEEAFVVDEEAKIRIAAIKSKMKEDFMMIETFLLRCFSY